MKVIWTPEAEADRTTIFDYLEARDPSAAARIDGLSLPPLPGLQTSPCSATPEKSQEPAR